MLQNHVFVELASRSGFGAAISAVIMNKKASRCKQFFVQKFVVCKASLCKSLLCVKASMSNTEDVLCSTK